MLFICVNEIFSYIFRSTSYQLSTEESDAIEKFVTAPSNLNLHEQHHIVIAFNRFICNRNIHVMRDHERNSWMLVHYTPQTSSYAPNAVRKLEIYTTEANVEGLHSTDKRIINNMFRDICDHSKPMALTSFAVCKPVRKPENRLVFIIAYAMCNALSQKPSAFYEAIPSSDDSGDDNSDVEENTEKIRKIIAEILKNGRWPEDTSEKLWNNEQ